MNAGSAGSPPERSATAEASDRSSGPAVLRHQSSSPPGVRVPVLDLQPGEVVHLPLAADEDGVHAWSGPVTITGVLLIDSGLAQVRWAPEKEDERWGAHLLLTGPAYAAGAIRVV